MHLCQHQLEFLVAQIQPDLAAVCVCPERWAPCRQRAECSGMSAACRDSGGCSGASHGGDVPPAGFPTSEGQQGSLCSKWGRVSLPLGEARPWKSEDASCRRHCPSFCPGRLGPALCPAPEPAWPEIGRFPGANGVVCGGLLPPLVPAEKVAFHGRGQPAPAHRCPQVQGLWARPRGAASGQRGTTTSVLSLLFPAWAVSLPESPAAQSNCRSQDPLSAPQRACDSNLVPKHASWLKEDLEHSFEISGVHLQMTTARHGGCGPATCTLVPCALARAHGPLHLPTGPSSGSVTSLLRLRGRPPLRCPVGQMPSHPLLCGMPQAAARPQLPTGRAAASWLRCSSFLGIWGAAGSCAPPPCTEPRTGNLLFKVASARGTDTENTVEPKAAGHMEMSHLIDIPSPRAEGASSSTWSCRGPVNQPASDFLTSGVDGSRWQVADDLSSHLAQPHPGPF